MIRFIDRNQILLSETRDLALSPSQTYVGGSSHVTGVPSASFHTIDCLTSPSLQRQVYVGRKTIHGSPSEVKGYFLRSLANLFLLEEQCPEISAIVPVFMGAVIENDIYKSILMEDYSKGNSSRVYEMTRNEQNRIPDWIKRIMEPEDKDFKYDDLARAFVIVDGQLRVLDTDSLPLLNEHKQAVIQKRVEFELQPDTLEKHLIRLS